MGNGWEGGWEKSGRFVVLGFRGFPGFRYKFMSLHGRRILEKTSLLARFLTKPPDPLHEDTDIASRIQSTSTTTSTTNKCAQASWLLLMTNFNIAALVDEHSRPDDQALYTREGRGAVDEVGYIVFADKDYTTTTSITITTMWKITNTVAARRMLQLLRGLIEGRCMP